MNLSMVRVIGTLPPQDPSNLYDTLFCASLAVLLAESGDKDGAEAALLEARTAAGLAAPAGSDLANGLDLVLAAAGRVREATS